MKIRTKIAVEYNSGIAGTATGVIEGTMISAGWINNPETNEFDRVGINYTYNLPDGTILLKDGLTIEGESYIEGLYNEIKGSIPSGLSHVSESQTKFYLAFAQQMAATFGIETTDIEII